jgi:hypothetical protein
MKKKKLKKGVIILILSGILFFSLVTLHKEINLPKYLLQKDTLTKSLYELSKYDKRIIKIIENQEAYPTVLLEMLSRNVDLIDYVLDYNQMKNQVFTDNIGYVEKGVYPLLLQYDKRWGYGKYGNSTVAVNGCGPTSIAMIIAGLTGKNEFTPYDIATYAEKKGYYQNGTSWSFFTTGVKHFGIEGESLPLSKKKINEELNKNHPILLSMRPGDFTTTGHIILITGMKDGKFIIHDPNSKERSNKLWSYETLEHQIKNLWAFKTI